MTELPHGANTLLVWNNISRSGVHTFYYTRTYLRNGYNVYGGERMFFLLATKTTYCFVRAYTWNTEFLVSIVFLQNCVKIHRCMGVAIHTRQKKKRIVTFPVQSCNLSNKIVITYR